MVFNWSAFLPIAVFWVPVALDINALATIAVLEAPVMVRLPAPAPAKKLSVPKLWMYRFAPDIIIPVVAVLDGNLKFPVISSCNANFLADVPSESEPCEPSEPLRAKCRSPSHPTSTKKRTSWLSMVSRL